VPREPKASKSVTSRAQATAPGGRARVPLPRCEQLREGDRPTVPDHAPRRPYRGTGRDPYPRG
jgi:hypothetical protein